MALIIEAKLSNYRLFGVMIAQTHAYFANYAKYDHCVTVVTSQSCHLLTMHIIQGSYMDACLCA
jgi:hypothetical protein